LARRHFAPKMRAWRRDGITASGQNSPIFIAYRRLERGGGTLPDIAIAIAALSFSLDSKAYTRNTRQQDQC